MEESCDKLNENEIYSKDDIVELKDIINDLIDANKLSSKEWIECTNRCSTIGSNLIRSEIRSTLYMLEVISASMLNGETLIIHCNESLTGRWKEDVEKLRIDEESVNPRLIMGFGPSASGKTFWAGQIVKLIGTIDPNFPIKFLAIDGGKQRETSKIYQAIISNFRETNTRGFSNLVQAGFNVLSKSMFDSKKVKKYLHMFLNINRKKISLYVPDTFAYCGLRQCDKKINSLVDITGDNYWIGLMIYQHKIHGECPYLEHKCVGCTESGKKREQEEGKKYSNTAHPNSMINGFKYLQQSQSIRLLIHNSGSPNVNSIIYELPIKKEFRLMKTDDYTNELFVKQNSVTISLNKPSLHRHESIELSKVPGFEQFKNVLYTQWIWPLNKLEQLF